MATISEMVHIANPMPLPTGTIFFQTSSGPNCENCPRATSIKYIGFPEMITDY